MTKVITFATKFPKGHPREGQPTYFVEKIYAGLAETVPTFEIPNTANDYWDWHEYYNTEYPKYHTIRKGNRWKVGDTFSPRIWSGKPYQSKQVVISPDLVVKKVWNIEIQDKWVMINQKIIGKIDTHNAYYCNAIVRLAEKDGLSANDFIGWFNKDFQGQIICWADGVEY